MPESATTREDYNALTDIRGGSLKHTKHAAVWKGPAAECPPAGFLIRRYAGPNKERRMQTSIENRIKSFYEHNGYKYAPPYPCVAANCCEVSRDPDGQCWQERWPGVYMCPECAVQPRCAPVDLDKFPKLMAEPEHKPGPIERAFRWFRRA